MSLISLIVPTCQADSFYLDNCLESIQLSKHVKTEIIVVSSCEKTPKVSKDVRLIEVSPGTKLTTANNTGIRALNPESTHVVFANDDVIFSCTALAQMQMFCQNYAMMLNPLSNCDNGWRYQGGFTIINSMGKQLPNKRFYTKDDVTGFIVPIMGMQPGYDVAVQVDHLPMYCSMIPKKVLDLVGEFDEEYELTYDDTDFCLRARENGVAMFTHMGAFVMHFGGTSSEITPDRDAKRERSRNRFLQKWGEDVARHYGAIQ